MYMREITHIHLKYIIMLLTHYFAKFVLEKYCISSCLAKYEQQAKKQK